MVIFLVQMLDTIRIKVSFSNKLWHYSSNFDIFPKGELYNFYSTKWNF